jgi:transcriptional regulator with XRE-family HTH domain
MASDRKKRTGYHEQFGDNVKRIREDRGYTQEELGKETGLSKSYISDVERAMVNISLENMVAIAEHLQVDLAILLTDVEDQ